ncbi:Chaperone protein DnaJ [subsurface metagenome]
MKKKIGVYYDFQNIYDYSFDSEEYDIQINFIEDYCLKLGKITIKNLYLKGGKYRNENKIVETHQKEYSYKVVFGPYKKDIDTLMASDFMENASKNVVDICVIISGDTDFVAPIEKVLNRKKLVHVLCNSGTFRKYKGIAESCSVFQILPERCRKCEGEGEISEICNKCNGKGEIDSECRYCDGTGWGIGAYCKNCEGTGWLVKMCTICNGSGVSSTSNCDECAATGNIDKELCSTCFGLGKKVVKCTRCEGTGIFSKEKYKICEGKGSIEISKREICSTCGGTGIYSTNECRTCDGTGKYKKFCWRCKGGGYITYPIE